MKILAVDTSGKEIGIGVFEGKKSLYEKYLKADRLYNRHIMPLVSEALIKSGVKLEEIDVFAAALGPGSFTGIRVGMAVMKSFAHALDKRFAGVSTLDMIAAEAPVKGRKWAVLEAGREELFAAEYGRPGNRPKYLLLTRQDFFKKLKKGDTVAGIKAENIMVELTGKSSKIHIAGLERPGIKSLAALITGKGRTDKSGIYKIAPVYIRPSEAEARRRQNAKTGGKVK